MLTTFGGPGVLADPAVQYHCAGGLQLAGDTRLSTLHKIFTMPSAANFEDVALTRFSRLLTNSLRLGNNPSSVSMIEPLLSDVLEQESLGRFGGASAAHPSFILAIRVETKRAQLWKDTLARIFGETGDNLKVQDFSGLRWNTGGPGSFWVIPARDWLLVGCGGDFSTVQYEYLSKIKAEGRPIPALTHNWLEADLESDGLGGWFRLLKPAHIRLTVAQGDDGLHVQALVTEATDVPWKSASWQIPKELMGGQLISFTAGQNVAAFLNINTTLSQLGSNPLTNQFYFWALDQMPLLNYMAWPVSNASNALEMLSVEAPAVLNPVLRRFNGTELVWNSKAGKLAWQNMRLFVPILESVRNKDGEFLLLSTFPKRFQSTPIPEALLNQIEGRTNVAYYDWEVTGRRLSGLQMVSVMIANRAAGTNDDTFAALDAESQWINGVARLAGNTITEITRVAPNELSIEREASVGFTAVELILLSDWLCDANSGPIHSSPPSGNIAPPVVRP
jgi:hypothetical protein